MEAAIEHVLIAGPITTAALGTWLGGQDAPAGRGGMSVSRLIGGLLDSGRRVTVATNDPSIVSISDAVSVSHGALTIEFGPYRPAHRSRDVFKVERQFISDVVERTPADVVHAHWTYEEAMGAMAVRDDVVVTARDWAPAILWHHRHPYRAVRLGMQVKVLRGARLLSVPSPAMKDRVERLAKGPVEVIPNSVDEVIFSPADRTGPSASPVLVAANVGWGPNKNVGRAIEALAIIRRTIPSATLRLLGTDHGPGEAAEAWAREQGLTEGVTFVGQVDAAKVLREMRSADLFLHVAREESFGNVLAEAMSQATPVLGGSSSGAVPWVIGDAGVLVDIDDAAAIATGVTDLLADLDRWRLLSARGRERAWSEFRNGAVTERFVRLYEQVR